MHFVRGKNFLSIYRRRALIGRDTKMSNVERFTDSELNVVVEQGVVYMCACPSQVAHALQQLRAIMRYQADCLKNPSNDKRVHESILQHASEAHTIFENCLDEVIRIEGWDRTTLRMPEGLRVKLLQEIQGDCRLQSPNQKEHV